MQYVMRILHLIKNFQNLKRTSITQGGEILANTIRAANNTVAMFSELFERVLVVHCKAGEQGRVIFRY